MYWGPHHLWGQGGRGQGGSKLKLAPLPSSSLPSLQLTPNSLQLTPSSLQPPSLLPSLQLAPSSLQPPSSIPLLQLTPSLLPALFSLQLAPACSQLSPASQLTPLAPACSQLAPSSLQPPSSLQLAPSSLQPPSSLQLAPSSLPNANEQLSMYWGPHHLWGQGGRGQGGSKLKLAPLTPRSLPSLPSPCYHSHLTGPCSQWPTDSLLCIGSPPPLGARG